MSTTIVSPSTERYPRSTHRSSPVRRFFGVVSRPQTYRNIGYLLLGLPLGVTWFAVLVAGFSTAVSLLVVALLGIPMLIGLWYAAGAFANVERTAANRLLGQHLVLAPASSGVTGNLWVRLRSMSSDRGRWRELGYLMLRFPVGIATFVATVTALTIPVLVAYAPVSGRHDDHAFGQWRFSSTLADIATSSPWSWLLVPLGIMLMFIAVHLLNAIAAFCGRWATAWLGAGQPRNRVQ